MKTKNYLIMAALAAGCAVSTAGLAVANPVVTTRITNTLSLVAGQAVSAASTVNVDILATAQASSKCYSTQIQAGKTEHLYTGGCPTMTSLVFTPSPRSSAYWTTVSGGSITFPLVGGAWGGENLSLDVVTSPKCSSGTCTGTPATDGTITKGVFKVHIEKQYAP